MYLLVIKQLVIMLIIAVSGFALSRIFKFGKDEQKFVSKFLLYFINPCLILSHFNLDFNFEKLKNLGIVILISSVVHGVMLLLGILFFRSKTVEGKELDSIDKIAIAFTNCAFIGIPLIEGVLGSEGVFYLLGYIVVFNIFLWTFGYAIIDGKVHIKKLVTNPNIIAVFCGIILFCIPVKLPEIIYSPLKLIGGMNTATSMVLLGMLFANFNISSDSSIKTYIARGTKLTLFRLVVCAVVNLLIIVCIFNLFNFVQDIKLICFVVFISSLCPVGMSVSSFAVLFNKDESYSGFLVIETSIFSIITIPCAVAIAELFIK